MNKLKALREEQGLSMMEMAKRLNIPYTTYVNYEKGAREPNSEMLIKFSKFFDVTIDYLIGNSEQKNKTVERNNDETLNSAFFRLKKGLEPFNLDESDADFLLKVFKAHKEKNEEE